MKIQVELFTELKNMSHNRFILYCTDLQMSFSTRMQICITYYKILMQICIYTNLHIGTQVQFFLRFLFVKSEARNTQLR